MLFIDYSSAFNTIVPSKLVIKLDTLGLDPALCNWVLDFLIGRPQVVRVGNNISTPLILNTGAPQWCVLSRIFLQLAMLSTWLPLPEKQLCTPCSYYPYPVKSSAPPAATTPTR